MPRAARRWPAWPAVWMAATLVLATGASADDGWDVLSGGSDTPPVAAPSELPGEQVALEPVDVSVLATPLAAPAGDPFVSVVVEIGGPELLRGTATEELQGRIDVRAVAIAGAPEASLRQPFVLGLDQETRQRLATSGLKLFGTLRLPPGSYRLTATVVAGERQVRGEQMVPLEVPDLGRGAASVSPALVPHGLERWKAFQQSEGGHPEAGYAYVAPGGAAFLPATHPALPIGQPVSLYLLAYGPVPETAARVLDDRGQVVAQPGLAIEAREPGDRPGEERLAVRLEPLPLPHGSYVLEIVAGRARSRIPIDLVARESSSVDGSALVAAAVREEEPAPELDASPIDPREVRGLEARYAEIVAGLERGDFEASVERLVAFERAVFAAEASSRLKALRTLRKAQSAIAEDLAGRDPEGLLPLLYAHYRADASYQAGGVTWAVAQNRAFLAELVHLYVDRAGAAGARRGAQFLAAVGAPTSALEIDPDNELALLRVALGYEKGGSYRLALPLFERLAALRPGEPHAQLRLAVNRRRTGDTAGARNLLTDCIASEAPTWIRLVAYQELAELEVAARRVRSAQALLRRGIEETGDQSLYLQLAYLLDRDHRRDEAVAVLNRVAVDRAGMTGSARHRYNGPPVDELASAQAELLGAARAAVPALRLAMARSGAFSTEVSP